MSQYDGEGFRPLSFYVIEVNVILVDTSNKLRIPIQICLRLTPVIFRDPVLRQRFHVVLVGAVTPVRRVETIGKPSLLHARDDAIDRGLGNVHFEWSNHAFLPK